MKKLPIGFYVTLYGNVLILLWLGIFKFTNKEAAAIIGLVKNSPFMSWLYSVLSTQGASNLIGTFEIITALLLASFPFNKKTAFVGAAMNTLIYLGTLSFLFTTPGTWRIVEGVPVVSFSLIKDIMALGIGLFVLAETKNSFRKSSST